MNIIEGFKQWKQKIIYVYIRNILCFDYAPGSTAPWWPGWQRDRDCRSTTSRAWNYDGQEDGGGGGHGDLLGE